MGNEGVSLCLSPGAAVPLDSGLAETGASSPASLEADPHRGVGRAELLPRALAESPPCLFQLLGAPGDPWLVAATLQSPPLPSRGLPPVSPCPSSSYKDLGHRIRVHSTPP